MEGHRLARVVLPAPDRRYSITPAVLRAESHGYAFDSRARAEAAGRRRVGPAELYVPSHRAGPSAVVSI